MKTLSNCGLCCLRLKDIKLLHVIYMNKPSVELWELGRLIISCRQSLIMFYQSCSRTRVGRAAPSCSNICLCLQLLKQHRSEWQKQKRPVLWDPPLKTHKHTQKPPTLSPVLGVLHQLSAPPVLPGSHQLRGYSQYGRHNKEHTQAKKNKDIIHEQVRSYQL